MIRRHMGVMAGMALALTWALFGVATPAKAEFIELDVPEEDIVLVEDEASEPDETIEPDEVLIQSTPTSGTYGGCTYSVSNGTLTISAGSSGILEKDLFDWPWRNDSSITKVVISSGVKAGSSLCGLFQGMSNLTTIEGLKGLTSGRQVTDMSYMFYQCYNLKFNLSELDTSSVTNMSYMFMGMKFYTLSLKDINTSSATNMEGMFRACGSLTSVNLDGANTSQVTNMSQMFASCGKLSRFVLGNAKTSNVTTMAGMFDGCSKLQSLDLSGIDTSNVADMSKMFEDCTSLTTVNLSTSNFANATTLAGMFYGCTSLQSVVLPAGGAPKAKSFSQMFNNCGSLTSIDGISNLVTSSATDLSYMFWHCTSLTSLDLSVWNTSRVSNMACMFLGCAKLVSLNLKGWTTPCCTSMQFMFWDCAVEELDLSGFNTANLGTLGLTGIFGCCNNLYKLTLGPSFCVRQVRYVDDGIVTQSATYGSDDDISLLIDQMNYEDALPAGVATVTGADVHTLLNDGDSWVIEDGDRTPRSADYVMNYHATARNTTITWVWKSKAKPVPEPAPLPKTSIKGAKVKLVSSSLAYSGKVCLPTIKTVGGKTLPKGSYTIKYSNASSKNIGTYKVWVVGKGSYAGTSAKATYKIVPKATTLKRLVSKSRAFVVYWKKQATKTTGYQIQYSRSKQFASGNKTVTVLCNKTTSKKIGQLTAKKRYYVRVHTYKKVGSKKYYSAWSTAQNVRTL